MKVGRRNYVTSVSVRTFQRIVDLFDRLLLGGFCRSSPAALGRLLPYAMGSNAQCCYSPMPLDSETRRNDLAAVGVDGALRFNERELHAGNLCGAGCGVESIFCMRAM